MTLNNQSEAVMPTHGGLFRFRDKKRDQSEKASLARDLTLALFIKFCLLVILWWTFFAGKKVPIDAGQTAHALLDTPMNHLQEKPR
jgi:hypothetical protein